MFISVITTVWSSPSLPILLGPNSPVPMTSSDSSWIVLYSAIGFGFSTVPVYLFSNRFAENIQTVL